MRLEWRGRGGGGGEKEEGRWKRRIKSFLWSVPVGTVLAQYQVVLYYHSTTWYCATSVSVPGGTQYQLVLRTNLYCMSSKKGFPLFPGLSYTQGNVPSWTFFEVRGTSGPILRRAYKAKEAIFQFLTFSPILSTILMHFKMSIMPPRKDRKWVYYIVRVENIIEGHLEFPNWR